MLNENNKDCDKDNEDGFALDHLSGLKFNLDKEGKRISSPAVKLPVLLTKMAKASTGPTRLSKTPQSSNKRQYPASKKKKSTKKTKRDFSQKKTLLMSPFLYYSNSSWPKHVSPKIL